MPLLDRADSVVIVIDAQPSFINQQSMNVDERSAAEASLVRLAWLLGVAGLLEIPVVAVEDSPERNGSTDPRVAWRIPEGAPVLQKRAFSLAAEPEVLAAVDETARKTTILAGFETDTSVAQSAIELSELGHRVVVLEDACYSAGETEHRRGLERMRQGGVEISCIKNAFFEWTRQVDEAMELAGRAVERFGPAPLRL